MSDSLPPNGGPGPYDGWDLEGLLSGDNVWLPDGMRPVAVTLAALRSAPARTELSSEAAARAAFRDIMRPVATGPVAAGPVRPGAGADDANTLILPARPPDGGPHVVTRPRHSHRRPPTRGRWGSKVLLGVAGGAAAVVIVGGIALAGTFSGSGAHPGQPGLGSGSTSAAPQTSHPGSNGVEGTASTVPSPTPSHTSGQQSSSGAAPGPSELCRQYLDFIAHPSRFDQAEESGEFQQLRKLAGGPWHVIGYCMQLQPWSMMPNGDESDAGGPGFPPGSQGSSGGAGSQGDKIGQHAGNSGNSGNSGNTGSGANGSSGVGNAGNGSQQSVVGPGPGNQGQQ